MTMRAADTWVVIVSGGSGFYNYALQSNAYHAYGVIRGHGVPQERVIMMAVDDLAFHDDNPFPGQIFNEANGPDVYAGVSFDYREAEVTPANFHAILRGDRSAVSGGSGRVLERPRRCGVYAMTAARADQLAFFTFCDLPVIRVCLATTFSHGWIVNSAEVCSKEERNNERLLQSDPTIETLEQQFRAVSELVSGANVSDFGDRSIRSESIALFQGGQKIGGTKNARDPKQPAAYSQFTKDDVPLRFLESKLRDARQPADRRRLEAEIRELMAKRAFHDEHTNSLVRRLVDDEERVASIRRDVPAKVTQFDCHQAVVGTYHERCFNLGTNPYAQRAARVLAALCEDGHSTAAVLKAIDESCTPGDRSRPTGIH
ncbi:Legumain [Aphelenchoides fujianensis]|nr:Legumain [Aphelenchoides fujianensis]